MITNLELPALQALYSGKECDTNIFAAVGPPVNVPVTVIQREPMSGTMNTHEFTDIRCGGTTCTSGTVVNLSQETGVNPSLPNNNPLNLACASGGGKRMRAIGTGELIGTGVLNTPDSIGFTFFGFGNVSKLAGSANYGYLTVHGIDPIQTTYATGQLPVCTSSAGSGVFRGM